MALLPQIPLIVFAQLKLPTSPNYCLVCPDCHGSRKLPATQYDVPVETLQTRFQQMIAKQPRVQLLQSRDKQFQYVQRSAVFKFPDIIDVKFVALNKAQSTLYIFSRSLYGYWDIGVNCRRLKAWIADLGQ